MRIPLMAACVAVVFAVPAVAQDMQDAALMRLFQAGNEVGRESFARTASSFESVVEIPLLQARLRRRTTFAPDGSFVNHESAVHLLSNDSLLVQYWARQDGDTLRWRQVRGTSDTSGVAATRPHAVAMSQSTAVFIDLAYRAAGRDTSVDLWSPEGAMTATVTITHREGAIEISAGGLPILLSVRADGRVHRIDVPAQRVTVERADPNVELPALPGLERPAPDYSAPPDAHYTATEVRVPVTPSQGEAFELTGTLTIPKSGRGPFPAVITMTGSGGQDRDENLWPLVPTYRPFAEIAARLAAEGIAVLRVDDRGIGASGGKRDSATIVDIADDVRAQVGWLRSRDDIDGARIALLGHSEGGVVGPMVAADDSTIAAIVVMAGSAVTGEEVLRYQVTRPIETAPGLHDSVRIALRDSALANVEGQWKDLSAWTQHFWSYDPVPTARRVHQPVLIVHGEFDRQVTVGQADTLAAAMRSAGNRDVTVRIFPKLNHLFLESIEDGSPHEYMAIEDTSLPPEVLDTIAEWLREKLGARR